MLPLPSGVSLARVFSCAHLFPSACYAGYGASRNRLEIQAHSITKQEPFLFVLIVIINKSKSSAVVTV